MVVMEKGKIVRSRVDEVRRTGRNTMGVKFAAPDPGDSIVAVARNTERVVEVEDDGVPAEPHVDGVPSETPPATDDASGEPDDSDGGTE